MELVYIKLNRTTIGPQLQSIHQRRCSWIMCVETPRLIFGKWLNYIILENVIKQACVLFLYNNKFVRNFLVNTPNTRLYSIWSHALYVYLLSVGGYIFVLIFSGMFVFIFALFCRFFSTFLRLSLFILLGFFCWISMSECDFCVLFHCVSIVYFLFHFIFGIKQCNTT